MKSDVLKAQILPYIPDIVAYGSCHKDNVYKERNDGTLYFLTFTKSIYLKGSKRNVIVDVKVSNNEIKHSVYNVNYEGSKSYIKRDEFKKALDEKTLRLRPRCVKDTPRKSKGFNEIIAQDFKNSSFEIFE